MAYKGLRVTIRHLFYIKILLYWRSFVHVVLSLFFFLNLTFYCEHFPMPLSDFEKHNF